MEDERIEPESLKELWYFGALADRILPLWDVQFTDNETLYLVVDEIVRRIVRKYRTTSFYERVNSVFRLREFWENLEYHESMEEQHLSILKCFERNDPGDYVPRVKKPHMSVCCGC